MGIAECFALEGIGTSRAVAAGLAFVAQSITTSRPATSWIASPAVLAGTRQCYRSTFYAPLPQLEAAMKMPVIPKR